MNENRTKIWGITTACILGIVALFAVMGLSERAGSATTLYEPARYGTVYLYDTAPSVWDDQADIDAMEAALTEVKNLGFNTVIQTFPDALRGTADEEDWLHFLDAAETVGIDVIAYLWPNTTYSAGEPDDPDDTTFDYTALEDFLDVVYGHPALIGFVGLHEPLEPGAQISSQELNDFYTHMKGVAPSLKIAHYMGDIPYWDVRRPDFDFSDGMCDFCMIWYYPFSCGHDVDPPTTTLCIDPVYEEDMVLPVVQSNLAWVGASDPDAEVWFLGQTFANAAHWRNLRMPTVDEMDALYLHVMQEPVDGFLWYLWSHTADQADEGLGDAGNEDQQDQAGDIPDAYTGYAGLEIVKSVSSAESWHLGGTITYTLTFTNWGPQPANSVVITDLVPGELLNPTVVGSSGAALTLVGGTSFVWTVDQLAVGQGGIITLTGIVDTDLEPGSVIRNTAEITAPLANNTHPLSATAVLTVTDALNSLRISKVVVPDGAEWHAGDTITYTLAFTNDGPHVAVNVVITDLMPAKLRNPAVVGNAGAAVVLEPGTTFVWTVSSMDVGEHGIITLTAVIASNLEPMSIVKNKAQIMAPIADPGGDLNATATISISDSAGSTVYLPFIMVNSK